MKLLLLPFVLMALCSLGCSQVKPWERGTLARPEMAFVPDAMEQTIQNHVYHSKEATKTVAAGSGGGCGCN